MKVYIGPHINFIGPYQIAEKILFWMDKDNDDRVHKFGTWLAGKDNHDTLLTKVCSWIYKHRSRTINIRIDKYDTWNIDGTLSPIILPMLIQLKEAKHGAPFVDDKDVPKELRSTSAPKKEHEWDTDDNHFKRWDWVLDEMIWAFEQKTTDWEQQFYSGEHDILWIPSDQLDEKGEPLTHAMEKGPKDTFNIDMDGMKKHQKRMKNGFALFGKYYEGLWD
jgi:hypothetical protein